MLDIANEPPLDPSHTAGLQVDQGDITVSGGTVNIFSTSTEDRSLPVQLSSFSATSIAEGVKLNWRTESEVNNVGFNVYRSTTKDGNFTKLGFVEGHGSTPFGHDYSFADAVKTEGTYFYYIEDIDVEGKKERSDIISVTFKPQRVLLPTRFELRQNFPNPFNPETWIPFQLPRDADVMIEIYNLNGQLIRTLSLGTLPAGYYNERRSAAFWDGRLNTGEKSASGIYFYRLKAGDYSAVKRMVIIK